MSIKAPSSSLAMPSDRAGEPLHVAIIMDGNGRWAKVRGLPRSVGHRAGVQALKRTLEAAPGLGIDRLTVFGFSTENWRRPPQEVSALMETAEDLLSAPTSTDCNARA